MQISWSKLGVTLLALGSIPAAYYYTTQAIANIEEPTPEPSQVIATKVRVIQLTAGSYSPLFEAYGEVTSAEKTTVPSQVAGTVIWRNPSFVEGGLMHAGDVLVRLDETDLRIAIAAAEETLANAQINLQTEQRLAKQALVDWQRSGINQAPPASLLRKAQINLAKASLKVAEARLQQARQQVTLTEIRVPFDALVTQRHVNVGNLVNPASAIASLEAIHVGHVNISLTNQQWQKINGPSQAKSALVQLADTDAHSWTGKIVKTAYSLDTGTRMRSMTIAVQQPLNQDQPLLFGSFTKVSINGAPMDNLLPIPAVSVTADGHFWYVHEEQLQKAKLQPQFANGDTYYINQQTLPVPLALVNKPLSSYLVGSQVVADSTGASYE